VPRLFAGTLPNFNIGTYDGASCDRGLTERIERCCEASGFSRVTNGRFKGGYITRRYGAPERGIHAVQMETAIRTYMDEAMPDQIPPAFDPGRAAAAQAVLADIIATCIDYASEGT
jgi:formiminoglutamase